MTNEITFQVPDCFRIIKKFINWYPERNTKTGKTDKIPCNLLGYKINPHDPENWLNLTTALTSNYNVGLDITGDDDIAFVDLDGCRDAETDYIHPNAQKIIEMFPGAVMEISQSGTGLHIFAKCNKKVIYDLFTKDHWNKNNDKDGKLGFTLEVYTHGRFAALTFNWLVPNNPGSLDIDHTGSVCQFLTEYKPVDRPTPTTPVSATPPPYYPPTNPDNKIIELASDASNGHEFLNLFHANGAVLSSKYPATDRDDNFTFDHSSADLALCSLLAFWTAKDFHQIDRIFRKSGLYRDKWEREKYRISTINKAIAGCHDIYGEGQSSRHLHVPPGTKSIHAQQKFAGVEKILPEGSSPTPLNAGGSSSSNLQASSSVLQTPPLPGIKLVFDDEIQPDNVQWLWLHRIPRGKVSLFAGAPGVGKSTLTMKVAATVSNGYPWPDDITGPEAGTVILLNAEDGVSTNIKPRYMASGGKLGSLAIVESVIRYSEDGKKLEKDIFNLEQDILLLQQIVEQINNSDRPNVRLIIVDPLNAFWGGRIDSFKDQDVRRALSPLKDFAEKNDIAVLCVTHFRKSGANTSNHNDVLDKFSGSVGITGAARICWAIVKETAENDEGNIEDTGRVLMLRAKGNDSKDPGGIAYTIENHTLVGHTDKHGEPIKTSRLIWSNEPVHITADQAMTPQRGDKERPKLKEAIEFLKTQLLEGPKSPKDLKKAAEACFTGSWETIRKAKKEMQDNGEIETIEDGKNNFNWQLKNRVINSSAPILPPIKTVH